MKKVLAICNSVGKLTSFGLVIHKKFNGKLFDEIRVSDSFDETIHFLKEHHKENPDDAVVVITSMEFHDSLSLHWNVVPESMSDDKKTGDTMAEEVKKIYPKAIVCAYSKSVPKTGFVDEHVWQSGEYNKDEKALLEFLTSLHL